MRTLLSNRRQTAARGGIPSGGNRRPAAYAPGYNIAPTTTQPVIRQDRKTFEREIVPMRWGLVGFGTAKIDPKHSIFNAKAEGLANSSLWNRPLYRHRCIVPISGFYEWRKPERTAFRFTVANQPLIGLAGLWDAWKAPDESWLQSFTIITTNPNVVALQFMTGCQSFSSQRTLMNG